MKKFDLKKIALASLIVASLHAEEVKSDDTIHYDPEAENAAYHLMSEEELLENLNAKSKEIYNNLTPEGKELARKVASQNCNNTNECKGFNACKTETNDCAGKGSCRGTSKCAFSDKNLAVKLVAEKMAKKRQNTIN